LIDRCNGTPVIVGGDWNTTVSTLDSPDNIDIYGMLRPPSSLRSNLLSEICIRGLLTDPFRALHPEKRDYTYTPRTGRAHRSRLDFFLISDALLYYVSNCSISNALTCSLFDHKPIFLNLGPPDIKAACKIFSSTLKHYLFDHVLAGNVIDTYLNHAAPHTPLLVEYKIVLGRLLQAMREVNNLDWQQQVEGVPPNVDERDRLLQLLSELAEALPGMEILNEFDLTTTPDTFFEILCSNLRHEILGFQGFQKKLENAKLNRIYTQVEILKTNYIFNAQEIAMLESEATSILDGRLSSRVSEMKIFENLHCERPTPIFLTLTKNRTQEKLALIKRDNGIEFENDVLRNEHIVSEFEKLYANRDPPTIPDNIIEDFLGQEIVDSPLVQNSLLTDRESEWLDRPLSISELDISAKKGKLRSAPGADGFSNELIIRCWKYFRHALYRYAIYCYDTGTLTHNFRSAKIKLIPKKGDLSKLKNWRPISLLSNFYKIISRAINLRLNKFVNRICSRAQKGYNNIRYAQEALINVWEQVNYCKTNGIKGAVIAIDMAKAFDTLSHKFLTKVYEFFRFGPNIRKWLDLLGNNRMACISLDSGCSRYFNLGRGRPQGDNISPNTFNFADQILIFKIELDPGIQRIHRPVPVLNNVPNGNDNDNTHFFTQEMNRETCKNESLADDNTTITLLDHGSLSTVKEILNSFALISGLECNFDKSCVMPTSEDPDPEDIELITSLGFKFEKKSNY
jgi:hypothetical protein